jgi:probable phosphoglycerate mutase
MRVLERALEAAPRRVGGVPEPGAISRREARQRADTAIEIVLLRHGEPDWTPDGGLSVLDAALTARGRLQAAAAAKALAEKSFDALYVSPLRRAQETAEPLAASTGIAPITLDGLAEITIPISGVSQTEVDDFFRRATQRRLAEHWDGWPGGERFRDFHARVTSAGDEILQRHGVARVAEDEFTVWSVPPQRHRMAIVAHGGTNAVLLTHLLDIAGVPWEWNRFEMELAAYAVVQSRAIGMSGFVWSLGNFNEVDHLRAAGLR